MKLDPVIDRLKAEVPALRQVDDVQTAAGIAELPIGRLPVAFVMPQSESAADNSRVGSVRQVVTHTVSVVIVVASNRRAGGVNQALDALQSAVKTALIGWHHPDASRVTTFRRARLLAAEAGAVSWQMDFEFTTQELES